MSSDIRTGEALWLISAQIGDGAQVKGASIQQSHQRCSGRGGKVKGVMYSLNSSESTKSSSRPVPKTAATTGAF